jgi:hypothetical protein
MQGRKPRSEIGKNALSVLSVKVENAIETGDPKDVYLAQGLLMGLDLAEMLRPGTKDAEHAKKHQATLDGLKAKLEPA